MQAKEKRAKMPPVPDDLDRMLTQDQAVRLRQLESFGWRVAFVRRPLFQEITVVLTSGDGQSTAILEADGELNMEIRIPLRA